MKIFYYINSAFDYMYYRISKAYYKHDGKSAITALLVISLFQNLLLFVPTGIAIRNKYGSIYFMESKPVILTIFIIIQFSLLIKAYFRYEKIRIALDEKWKNEKELYKTINGTLVVLALLFPFVIMVLL
jgi:hypothetical protein